MTDTIRVGIPLAEFDHPGVRARVERYAMDVLRDESGTTRPLEVAWQFVPLADQAICIATIGREDA